MIKSGCSFLSILLSVLPSAHATSIFEDGFEQLVTSIILPIDNSILDHNSDADIAPGFQVLVSFSTSDQSTHWVLSSQKGCDNSHSNCDVLVIEVQENVTNAGGLEPERLVTLALDGATTYHRIKLEAFDSIGNSTSSETRITVTVNNCSIGFMDIPTSGWYNGSVCSNGIDCSAADVVISVGQLGDCPGISSIRLFNGAVLLETDSEPAVGGTSIFNPEFADNAELALVAKAYESEQEIASTSTINLRTDFTPPEINFVSSDAEGFQTAASGDFEIYTTLTDLSPDPGMQFNARVSVVDVNVDGGEITSLSATGAEKVNLGPHNVLIPMTLSGASPVMSDFLGMSLIDQQTHAVQVEGIDAAGNQASASYTALVDLSPRNPIVVSNTVPSSPANDNSPEVIGIADLGSTVHLYSDPSCLSPLSSGPADLFNSTGITISVTDNSETTIYAKAAYSAGDQSACSDSSTTYVEDSDSPDTPTVEFVFPSSPANDNNPRFFGIADPGSIVRLFSDPTCLAFLNSGSAESFGTVGITIIVPDNSETTVYANSTDAAGNVSSCSLTFITYVEDSTL